MSSSVRSQEAFDCLIVVFALAFACCVGFDLKECSSCLGCPAAIDCLFTNWKVSGTDDVRDNGVWSLSGVFGWLET